VFAKKVRAWWWNAVEWFAVMGAMCMLLAHASLLPARAARTSASRSRAVPHQASPLEGRALRSAARKG
jgi:hypothetical protein